MMQFPPVNEQMDEIRRGTVDLISEDELVKKIEASIKTGNPLKAKLGADPTSPDLHIGHGVVLNKLRTFQDLGHKAILIIGDFTSLIGDPSGRSATRPHLHSAKIKGFASTYKDQATKVLSSSPDLLEIRYNSEWLGGNPFEEMESTESLAAAQKLVLSDTEELDKESKEILAQNVSKLKNQRELERSRHLNNYYKHLFHNNQKENSFRDLILICKTITVSQMLERDDFHTRFDAQQPIYLHEFLYPIAQAIDSAEIKADVELGGTDQKFNLLLARQVQKTFGQAPQCVLTMPLLEGTDGVRKMSKSYGNSINFSDSADEMFGKTMSIPDDVLYKYFVLATKVKDLAEIKASLDTGTENPRNIKVRLAKEIIKQFHDETAANAALERFELMFVKKEVPDDIPEVSIGSEPRSVVDMIVEHKLAASKSDARRLIQGSGVSLDGEKVVDEKATVTATAEGIVLKVGKRKFLKIRV